MSRVALVTGAASGIGAAIVQRLDRDGWDVLSVDIRGEVGCMADLTTRAGNAEAVATAVERFGRLDAVVPNAGFQHVAPVAEFPEERWDAITALLLTSSSCWRGMRGRSWSRRATGDSLRSRRYTVSLHHRSSQRMCRPSTAC